MAYVSCGPPGGDLPANHAHIEDFRLSGSTSRHSRSVRSGKIKLRGKFDLTSESNIGCATPLPATHAKSSSASCRSPHKQRSTIAMSTANLVDLPDELLLLVLNGLKGRDRQGTLHSLSLVNRRLANIMHGELYSKPSIGPSTAHRLLAHLLQEPSLATKVSELSVQHSWFDDHRLAKWIFDDADFKNTGAFTQTAMSRSLTVPCRRALRNHGVGDESWHWAPRLRQNDTFAYIAVILVIVPNLRRLTLSHQFASAVISGNVERPGANAARKKSWPYVAGLLAHGLENLEEIRLGPSRTEWKMPHEYEVDMYALQNLNFKTLKRIKRVEIALPKSANASFALGVSKLPPNVQTLHLMFCNEGATEEFISYPTVEHQNYPCLKVTKGEWDEEVNDELPVSTSEKVARNGVEHTMGEAERDHRMRQDPLADASRLGHGGLINL